MSHSGPGFFYFRFTYKCPWTDYTNNTSGEEHDFHSAYFAHVPREDHKKLSDWRNEKAMPAAREDIRKWYIGRNVENKGTNKPTGKVYKEFNELYIQVEGGKPIYCQKLPLHDFGQHKGQPFGRKIASPKF